jgi:hypothetical protein
MTEIRNMRNPRTKLSQSNKLLEALIPRLCYSKKYIIIRYNSTIDFSHLKT